MLGDEEKEKSAAQADDESDALQPLMALATAMLDTHRLRIAGVLANGPASRMELEQATGSLSAICSAISIACRASVS